MNRIKFGVALAGVMMASMGVSDGMAASPQDGQLREFGQPGNDDGGAYRFVVKYRDGAVERHDAARINIGAMKAASRAGVDRLVRATATMSARPAVQMRFQRSMAMPGWNVLRASRRLDRAEAAAFMRELKADPAVESVEIDVMMVPMVSHRIAAAPNDPDYQRLQWHFHNAISGVRAPQAWERSQGDGVVVAVIDTGFVRGNPDLQNNVLPGYDMITDKRVSRRDSDGRAAGGWDEGDWVEANYCSGWAANGSHRAADSSWHGTHVGGTVAQETHNGKGVAGLAYKAKVVPVRVLGSCGGFGSDISDGILWAAGGEVPGLPLNPNPAEIINMSLGSSLPAACPTSYQEAIDKANSLGAIIMVAAGNSNGVAGDHTMGSCKNVIVVGGSRYTGGKYSASNHGPRVDFAAPAGDAADGNPNGGVWQMINRGTTRPLEGEANWRLSGFIGTSMASPHAAAAAAMIQSVVQTPLTWQQMRDLLRKTASPFPVTIPANTSIGAGILNVDAALAEATKVPCNPEAETCGPDATALVNKQVVSPLTGVEGDEVLYSFQAEAGKVLSFMTYGGTGEVFMYVGHEREPTSTDYDARSSRSKTTSQTVRFTAPKAGTYYIKLIGPKVQPLFPPIGNPPPKNAYTGVNLVARQ
ncbi:MAG: S8 family serine peptidase [Stenotrophomonas sp.]|uniref:S8 family serine peptidase n=1 Tax=Stenotrophomonas sp. TaxID=69392 RepID=UPI003D6D9B74